MTVQEMIEIPSYGNPKKTWKLYEESKKRQQMSIVATAQGLMLMRLKKKQKKEQ